MQHRPADCRKGNALDAFVILVHLLFLQYCTDTNVRELVDSCKSAWTSRMIMCLMLLNSRNFGVTKRNWQQLILFCT